MAWDHYCSHKHNDTFVIIMPFFLIIISSTHFPFPSCIGAISSSYLIIFSYLYLFFR
jgi:hypothetical protein